MTRTFLWSLVLGPALLLAALVFPATAAAADPLSNLAVCTGTGTVSCDLYAKTGTQAITETTTVDIWGFAATSGGDASAPGPTIVVTQDDVVTVTVHNDLPVTTGVTFDGQAMIPDLTGIAPAGSKAYTFTASEPGTYLYEAGLIPGTQYQVSMGLYGVLIVRPTGAPGQAYGDAGTAFDTEAVAVLSEVDTRLNSAADPAAFDLRYFAPRYQLINGVAYDRTAPSILATAGDRLLLRYLNAGIQHHSMAVLGLHQVELALDGSRLPANRTVVAETINPGESVDVLIDLPATDAASTKYAVYDATMLLNNNGGNAFGGMLTFIDAAATPSGADTIGPITSALSFDLGTGALSASVSDVTTGNANVTAAEYFVDTTGASGTGTAMTGAFTSPTESVSATVLPPAGGWTSGTHTFYVHGQDAVGNWGAFSSVSFFIDGTGPITSALALSPSAWNGTSDVSLSGTASDITTGGSNVVAAEYFFDVTGADGTGTAVDINLVAPIVSLSATIPAGSIPPGGGVIWVHALDAAGNWGGYATTVLTSDTAGPQTSDVTAAPNPTNGLIPINSAYPAVQVTAGVSDAATGNNVVTAAEGFIDIVGADGTGFPFTPADGVFSSATESATAYIPLTTIRLLSDGNHTIYVHGRDAAGNWGATANTILVVDKAVPTFASLTAAPNPTLGSTTVTLTANGASDVGTGITGGEYWFGTTNPAPGGGTAFTGTSVIIPTPANGTYTVSARLRDAAGNWSAIRSTTLVVVPDAIFSDGFESGNTNAWTSRSTNSPGRLSVTTGAAMVGTYGLRASGNNANYVQYNFGADANNPAWPTFDARFYFRPNANSSTGKDIFVAASGTGFTNAQTLFRVRYRLNGSTPQVQIQLGTSTANATWTDITGGTASNVIEVTWQSGGNLVLYVNGVSSQTLGGASGSVTAFRLGSVTGNGNSTDLHFDAFAAKRTLSPLFGP